jgi:UDP-N-acetylglucosamine:LPS N-acetylglucosamine transferase
MSGSLRARGDEHDPDRLVTARPLTRALFISGSLGKGHDVLAEACADALNARGVECEIVDAMRMLGSGPGAVGDWVFRRLLSINAVYDAFHFSQMRDDGRLARRLDRLAVDWMFPQLRERMDRFHPELVVSVFATGAGGTARLKAAGYPITSVVAMTDSFAHRFWVHESTDLFLVTSPAAGESVRRYWPEARVEVFTAPVRPKFYSAPSRRVAREQLGIPVDATCALLMSGAWGLGPLDAAATELAQDGTWVLAVAGTNATMERKLRDVTRRSPNVITFGYTNRVPELMSACDVVVTSSGDTCREARTLGRGIVLLDVVPGHGRENLLHELELGGATACMPTPDSIARAVRSFVADPGRFRVPPAQEAHLAPAQFVAAVEGLGLKF